MTPAAKQRLSIALAITLGVGLGVALTLAALEQNVSYFYSPTQLVKSPPPAGKALRLGGLVKEGSVKRQGTETSFIATDTQQELKVIYRGLLPDLFREGQGVVAEGRLNTEGVFMAETMLARHDENYMPPEVARALQEAGAMPHSSKTETLQTGKTPAQR